MPPDRGRASKACDSCRKIKTRCYEPSGNGKSCLRCERLRQPCSLEISSPVPADMPHAEASHQFRSFPSHEERIAQLEKTVSSLVADLGGLTHNRHSLVNETLNTSRSHQTDINQAQPESPLAAAPVLLIRDVASQYGMQRASSALTTSQTSREPDIIEQGIITLNEAISLVKVFQEHYGRWVCFSERMPANDLLLDIRGSPLLLCVCCLIAVRHTAWDSATILAPRLFKEARSLMSINLLDVPQSKAFFQAAVILSMYSTTIGQTLLSIDSWLLSGFALHHSLASDLFASDHSDTHYVVSSRQEVDNRCILNHLCLAHLHYCVGTRRKACLDAQAVKDCRKILAMDQVTNFQTRMVAEIHLYWIIHESCLTPQVDLPGTQASLHEWRQEWKYLFDQPRSHFIQMGFHFAQLLVYDRALTSRSAAVRESLLSEMIRLSAAIIRLALDTTDDRTRHLSDHIYHMITFAAVTLCRLLHMYEDQLTSSHNIVDLDSLVLTLVTWLHSIGGPCHVAQTLGDVVAEFHKKLRPVVHPSPVSQIQGDIELYFPELLGVGSYGDGNLDYNPNWEPYIQGHST